MNDNELKELYLFILRCSIINGVKNFPFLTLCNLI